MQDEIDLVLHCEGKAPCWIGNHAQFIGEPIKPNGSLNCIQHYCKAVNGKLSYFLKQNNNKPADTARHMLNCTKGLCVVCKGRMPGSAEKFGQATVLIASRIWALNAQLQLRCTICQPNGVAFQAL
jgi:ferredoxin